MTPTSGKQSSSAAAVAATTLTLTLLTAALGGVAAKEQGIGVPTQDEDGITTTCFNPTSSAAEDDDDCPVRCVDSDEQQQQQEQCVPCVTYTDNPAQPDWGCTDQAPLCMTNEQEPPAFGYRSGPRIGTRCAPYPCRKRVELKVDEGCTQQKPRCVDALQQDALPEAYGIQCVAVEEEEEFIPTEDELAASASSPKFGLWGLMAQKQTNSFGLASSSSTQQNQTQQGEFEIQSLCKGCPLSGQGRDCESTKACDTLGGVHLPSSTTQPGVASGIYSW